MHKGYTIIEVALVLAVSGLLLIGLIAGFSTSVAQQRYNDAVQGFAEYLRAVYGRVENPEGVDAEGGNSLDYAYYGRVILLGESRAEHKSMACDYAIIAKADLETEANSDTLAALSNADNMVSLEAESQICYSLLWSADVENVGGETFGGAVLILRSPIDDVMHTYAAEGTASSGGTSVGGSSFYPDGGSSLSSSLMSGLVGNVAAQDVDFCVDSDDLDAAGNIRRDVRLAADGHNSSAVELIDVNSEDNKCDK